MKVIKLFVLTFIIFIGSSSLITPLAMADVWVNGYYRSNGTYVNGYYRSSPDGIESNNWSYCGNVNPHTGKVGTTDCLNSSNDSKISTGKVLFWVCLIIVI